MKKIIKSRIFLIIITTIIVTSISVYAATTYKASDVVYNASNGTSMNVEDALNELYSSKNNQLSSISFDLVADDFISATSDYGVTSGVDMSIPFVYKYAEIEVTSATANYAYIVITGGEKEGKYSNVTKLSNITHMTNIAIRAGTGYHMHYKCIAKVTFYF